jgi:beta-lactam-binding protein with PASTA domain
MSKFGAYLKTKDFRTTILLAIGSVIVVVLIAFFSLSFYTDHGAGIPVPKVTGLDSANAINLLKDQGFGYHIDSLFETDKPPGTIVEQDPDPGTSVKTGRMIYLTMIATLAPNVALPQIEQLPYIQAAATLTSYGLRVGDTTYQPDINRDAVIKVSFGGQVLKAGAKVPKGSRIDLILGNGSGAAELPIPELVGLKLDEAKFALKNSGFVLGIVMGQGRVIDTANAVIVDQYPKMTDTSSKAPTGTRINVTIKQ